jgi:hypothetical protein
MKKRLPLSVLEWVALALCVLYAFAMGKLALGGGDLFWSMMTFFVVAALYLLFGARRIAALLQQLIALFCLLICLLLLGILALCGKDEAPGFWPMVGWSVVCLLLALLHHFLGKHIQSRAGED